MDASDELKEVVTQERSVRLIEQDIYSVLPDTSVEHHYDKRAALYDLVVSTRLYNSVMWGSSPRDYIEFARLALNSSPGGKFLDAGCGSLLFTARIYADSNHQIIAFDQSLAMLRRARQRLIKLAGCVPKHIRLLQADLSDLPFRRESFRTVLCLNVLHQFADASALISNLNELRSNNGSLFLTSLVSNNRTVGNWYLKVLHRTGEFVPPRDERELRELFHQEVSYDVKGNMAFVSNVGPRISRMNTGFD
jgi:ubiquinone/menaquinone biosynthesis C-methylase UbiE